jgi:hypothetical protein
MRMLTVWRNGKRLYPVKNGARSALPCRTTARCDEAIDIECSRSTRGRTRHRHCERAPGVSIRHALCFAMREVDRFGYRCECRMNPLQSGELRLRHGQRDDTHRRGCHGTESHGKIMAVGGGARKRGGEALLSVWFSARL